MRSEGGVRIETEQEWVELALPGFEALVGRGYRVLVDRKGVRLTAPKKEVTISAGPTNREGASMTSA